MPINFDLPIPIVVKNYLLWPSPTPVNNVINGLACFNALCKISHEHCIMMIRFKNTCLPCLAAECQLQVWKLCDVHIKTYQSIIYLNMKLFMLRCYYVAIELWCISWYLLTTKINANVLKIFILYILDFSYKVLIKRDLWCKCYC